MSKAAQTEILEYMKRKTKKEKLSRHREQKENNENRRWK